MIIHNSQIIETPNFIYLASMMKSSSTLMWLVLSAIQEADNRADPTKMQNVPADDFLPLTIDFLKHFPNGGIFKSHAPYEHHTDKFFKQTGCKYVVLVRHPADHLAGLYCHCRGLTNTLEVPPVRRTAWEFLAGPVPVDFSRNEPDVAIDQMIDTGYLFKILEWMADWLAFRNRLQSRLIRYEDVVTRFDEIVSELCWFIRDRAADDDLMHYLRHVVEHETKTGKQKSDQPKYPRGWTGHIGAWQDYFSRENAERFNDQVLRFMQSYPQAAALSEAYPTLLLEIPAGSTSMRRTAKVI
jgi:Sulfotransferase domain